jgi:hypothetical protein
LCAEIKSISGKDGRVAISITGELNPGDTDVFKAAIKQANDAGKFVANVRLNSMGGNLLEGVRLAEAIRFGKMSTNVGKASVCASACFLVFAAGNTKFASYGAQIGVHGASDQQGQETIQSGAATVSMARVAKELGVPSAIIGRMVVTPPDEMVWLSPQELQSMGTAMVGAPSQVAIPDSQPTLPRQTAPADPIDLSPRSRASTSTNTKPDWDKMIETALGISAKQNNGKPLFARVCQPELKTCNVGLMLKVEGVDLILKVTKDMNDRTILREYCTINPAGDIRICTDWDTPANKHRDMKDATGAWNLIARE